MAFGGYFRVDLVVHKSMLWFSYQRLNSRYFWGLIKVNVQIEIPTYRHQILRTRNLKHNVFDDISTDVILTWYDLNWKSPTCFLEEKKQHQINTSIQGRQPNRYWSMWCVQYNTYIDVTLETVKPCMEAATCMRIKTPVRLIGFVQSLGATDIWVFLLV